MVAASAEKALQSWSQGGQVWFSQTQAILLSCGFTLQAGCLQRRSSSGWEAACLQLDEGFPSQEILLWPYTGSIAIVPYDVWSCCMKSARRQVPLLCKTISHQTQKWNANQELHPRYGYKITSCSPDSSGSGGWRKLMQILIYTSACPA